MTCDCDHKPRPRNEQHVAHLVDHDGRAASYIAWHAPVKRAEAVRRAKAHAVLQGLVVSLVSTSRECDCGSFREVRAIGATARGTR